MKLEIYFIHKLLCVAYERYDVSYGRNEIGRGPPNISRSAEESRPKRTRDAGRLRRGKTEQSVAHLWERDAVGRTCIVQVRNKNRGRNRGGSMAGRRVALRPLIMSRPLGFRGTGGQDPRE